MLLEIKNLKCGYNGKEVIKNISFSVPEGEFEETVHKSNAIRAAITLAENGLEQ